MDAVQPAQGGQQKGSGANSFADQRGQKRKRTGPVTAADGLANAQPATASTSFSAALARSGLLLLGIYFKRPSRLFRPTRVDTLATIRQLAVSSQQALSPAFIRALIKERGPRSILTSILPPLAVNSVLGTILFVSQSYFCYILAKLPLFAPTPLDHRHASCLTEDSQIGETHIEPEGPATLGTWLVLPDVNAPEDTFISLERADRLPHPTLLSALAGVGAGVLQGVAFTPVENVVKVVRRGTVSWWDAMRAVCGLAPMHPTKSLRATAPHLPALQDVPQKVKTFLGIPAEGWGSAWRGVRWGIARDGVGYGVFFAAFDASRRIGLAVREALEDRPVALRQNRSNNPANDLEKEHDQTGSHSAPTRARLAQASVLVAGGVTASLAAEFVARPFRHLEDVWRRHARTATVLHFSARPTQGTTVPFSRESESVWSVARRAIRQDGIKGLFRNPALEGVKVDKGLRARVSRLGWRLAGVGPWGFGFLVFAYVGGEV